MGWLDGFFGGQSKSNGSEDPLLKLDPALREFLEKESPVKVKPGEQPQQKPQTQPRPAVTTTPTKTTATDAPAADDADAAPRPLPQESQFQDGRYAHLWKTYRPHAEVEAETKSDAEKLQDVLDGYKARKGHIGRAALENCALEQADWTDCMKAGGWAAKLTMCSEQVRKFERCYNMQSRLLKALGYLSTYDRPSSVDEEIQMHADSLYHRMLEQEAAVAKAKEEGRPIPKFQPVISRATFPGQQEEIMTPEAQKRLKESLEELPEDERAAEEAARRADLRAQAEAAARLQGLWEEKAKERELRKQQGKETILDKVSGAFKSS